MIDPTKYGATKLAPATGIDPTRYGATKLSGTGIPMSAPPTVSQSFSERLNSLLNKPIFNMDENQSGLLGTTGKSLVNSAQSLGRFAKGTVDFVNPKNTFDTLKQIPEAVSGYSKDLNAAIASENNARQLEAKVKAITGKSPVAGPMRLQDLQPKTGKALYESVTPVAIQEAAKGNISSAIQSVAEDPFQLAPLLFMAKGFAEAKTIPTGKTKGGVPEYKSLLETEIGQKIDAGISKTVDIATKPITAPAKGLVKYGTTLAKYATSQATGLSPKSIETIINNPKEFSAKQAASYSREGIASEVKKGIDDRIAELQETGRGYEAVRTSNERVTVPVDAVQGVLDKYRIKVDETGKVVTSQESLPLSAGDKAALQDFVNTFNTQNLSANAFLNARTALSNMAKFDATKTSASTTLARELRTVYDTAGKGQIKGLKELDKIYSSEKEVLSKIKRDYLQADGTFKDGAMSKIANLNKAGREQVLSRLETIVPGVGKKLGVLNALEDMANASGQKVGAYGRTLLGGAGLATGNIAAIVAAILASPAIASQILRGYGNLKGIPRAVIEKTIKAVEKVLTTDITDVKIGLSVNDTGNSFYNRLNKYEAEALKKAKTEVKKKESADPLTTEARKYKSAEEFVNSQNLLHGTPNEIQGGKLTYGMKKGQDSGGLFLTDTPQVAETFRFGKGQVYRATPQIKNSVIDLTTSDGISLFRDQIGKTYKTFDGEVLKFTKEDFDLMFPNGKTDFASVSQYPELVQQIVKTKGKRGIAFEEYAGGKTGKTYQILDGDVPVYTKSQLTDIWKKANKKKVSK